ncbi:MAG: transglycosylase domain-containing protein [Bacteroidaceae bacterium]|nr:transglycosylase domain-containing protein [Bacteroidaceae bacterium]
MLKLFTWPFRLFYKFLRWYFGLYRNATLFRKIWLAFISVVLFIVLYSAAVMYNFLWLFGKSPTLDNIMHPKTPEASEIYSADGVLLGKMYNENRSIVPYDSIAPVFFEALIATEDARFYKHYGIDPLGIGGAIKDAISGRARGASTLTQQLVKNMFRTRSSYSTGLLGYIPGVRMLVMKSKEMILAVGIEMFYTKEEILTMYANTVDFGHNSFGIKTAARTFFNTSPARLKTEEAAVLVGLLKATSTYSPLNHPEASQQRRNVVYQCMVEQGSLSAEEANQLATQPIRLRVTRDNDVEGQAQYFRQAVADFIMHNVPEVDPYSDGLKIYTTLDSRMQRYAEQAVRGHMRGVQASFNEHWRGQGDPWRDERGRVVPGFLEKQVKNTDTYRRLAALYPNQPDSVRKYLNRPHTVRLFDYSGTPHVATMSTMDSLRYMLKFLHCGFIAMEPETGQIKAWVGDVDYKTWNYDKVTAQRQPGSTFKLFVYTTAMKQGRLPDDRVEDSPVSIPLPGGKKWEPHNANGRFSGERLPLHTAFARSVNSVAVKLAIGCGINNVVQTAHDMGIKSELTATPALALGASDVNLLEMACAYSCVANGGDRIEPVFVTRILNAEGEVLYEARTQRTRVLPEAAADNMRRLLMAGAHEQGGTSTRLGGYLGGYGDNMDYGGKTGTTNNHSDAWFVGVTPGLVGACWVGGEFRSIHFRTGALGQGSRLALPVFGEFIKRVMGDGRLRSRYQRRFTWQGGSLPRTYDDSTLLGLDDRYLRDTLNDDDFYGDEYSESYDSTGTSVTHSSASYSSSHASSGDDNRSASQTNKPPREGNTHRQESRNVESLFE